MVKFLFFILYIIFLSFISFSFIRVISFSFFFFYLFLSSTCPLSSVLSLPLSFIFFFSSRTFQTSEKRERERERSKDKAGGSIGHRKDRAGAALPRPRPTAARPPPHHQAGSDRLFFFFFLWCENTEKQRGESVREKKKSRGVRKNWYNSSLYDFLIKKIQLLMYSNSSDLMNYCS